jgi:hypothetical protein
MKNRILYSIALTILLFPSCKKDRECRCIVSLTNGPDYEERQDVLYKKVTKKEAKVLCKDYEESVYSGYSWIETHCRLE